MSCWGQWCRRGGGGEWSTHLLELLKVNRLVAVVINNLELARDPLDPVCTAREAHGSDVLDAALVGLCVV